MLWFFRLSLVGAWIVFMKTLFPYSIAHDRTLLPTEIH